MLIGFKTGSKSAMMNFPVFRALTSVFLLCSFNTMFQRVTQLGLNFHIQSFLMMKCFPFLLIFHDFSTPTSFSEAPRTIVLHRWRILQGLDIYRVSEMRTWFFQIKNGYRVKQLFQWLLSQNTWKRSNVNSFDKRLISILSKNETLSNL